MGGTTRRAKILMKVGLPSLVLPCIHHPVYSLAVDGPKLAQPRKMILVSQK